MSDLISNHHELDRLRALLAEARDKAEQLAACAAEYMCTGKRTDCEDLRRAIDDYAEFRDSKISAKIGGKP